MHVLMQSADWNLEGMHSFNLCIYLSLHPHNYTYPATQTLLYIYLGNREHLDKLQRSGKDLNPVQINRNREHCLKGCVNGYCYADHRNFECM